jgi:hypothetical protein
MLTLPSRPVVGKALTIHGYSMYHVPEWDFAAGHARLVAHAAAGELAVPVERVPLAEIADAWRRKTDGDGTKLVVVP